MFLLSFSSCSIFTTALSCRAPAPTVLVWSGTDWWCLIGCQQRDGQLVSGACGGARACGQGELLRTLALSVFDHFALRDRHFIASLAPHTMLFDAVRCTKKGQTSCQDQRIKVRAPSALIQLHRNSAQGSADAQLPFFFGATFDLFKTKMSDVLTYFWSVVFIVL